MAEANHNSKLPPEILVKIFEYCNNVNDIVNIVDVCQLWRDVIYQHNIPVNDVEISCYKDYSNLVSLLCKPVRFTKLHIVWDVPSDVDCSRVSLDALADVTSLKRLQSFMFRAKVEDEDLYGWCNVKDEDEDGFDRILEALLTSILRTSTDTLAHFNLSNIERTDHIRIRKVFELIKACPHLSHLVLYRWCRRCRFDPLENIISKLTHLEFLDLRGTMASRRLSFIAAVKRGCPNISNNIMVQQLDIISPSDDVSMLQFVSYVARLNILVRANQSLISSLNDYASQLTIDLLDIRYCSDHLTDDLLMSLVQPLRRLKYVSVVGCYRLTNEGVVNVVTSLPELKRISISFIRNITTDIIQLLDRVVREKNVHIYAGTTKLSNQMWNKCGRHQLYIGKKRNICLEY